MLTNEKYIGNNVYNRTSFKLKKLRVISTPEMCREGKRLRGRLYRRGVFHHPAGSSAAKARRYTDEELIERLRALHKSRGSLSGLIINETDGMPSSTVYAYRFGSLIRAYQMVGFTPEKDYRFLEVNRILPAPAPARSSSETERQIAELGGKVVRDIDTDLLRVNDEFEVSLVLARCTKHESGRNSWKVRFDAGLVPDITVAVRLNDTNEAPLDYYLLPRLDFGQQRLHLADHNPVEFESYRFDTLDYLYGMAERSRLRRVA